MEERETKKRWFVCFLCNGSPKISFLRAAVCKSVRASKDKKYRQKTRVKTLLRVMRYKLQLNRSKKKRKTLRKTGRPTSTLLVSFFFHADFLLLQMLWIYE